MKTLVCVVLSLTLMACSSKTGSEEKALATEAFINCNFYSAVSNAELAIKHAGDDLNVSMPAWLILAKSSEILENQGAATLAYESMMNLAPGVESIDKAKDIANNFVLELSKINPEKTANCPALQG